MVYGLNSFLKPFQAKKLIKNFYKERKNVFKN